MIENERPDLIYDWNTAGDAPAPPTRSIGLVDETLRDGLQSPSVLQPRIEEKRELLHLMARLGIDDVNIGLPASGRRFVEEGVVLASEVFNQKLPLTCHCAGRTLPADIEPIIEISQRAGGPLGAGLFIGSSPLRRYVEGWEVADLLKLIRTAIDFAVRHEIRVMFVTEDTTRTDPETVRQLYLTAIEHGAQQIVLGDTVGHATPHGAAQLVRFVRSFAGPQIQIDWHGHRDRGLAMGNALAAIEAGADRIHATALGIGERCGNTPMEQVLVNLHLLGYARRDLTPLHTYCHLVSRACGVPIPDRQPIVGNDAFRTASGVHAAAVVKALDMGDRWLADRVYSAVPASLVGRTQEIEIGPLSGSSSARYALLRLGIEPTDALIQRILEAAKSSNQIMSEVELLRIIVESVAETAKHATMNISCL